MAKLPKSVRVGPATYSISRTEGDFLAACHQAQTNLLGWTNHTANRIVLRPDQGASSFRDTLLHECLHAVTDTIGLHDEIGADEDEKLVRRLTPAVLDFIRDNPKLIEYLVEDS
jgi:hypothetical protein